MKTSSIRTNLHLLLLVGCTLLVVRDWWSASSPAGVTMRIRRRLEKGDALVMTMTHEEEWNPSNNNDSQTTLFLSNHDSETASLVNTTKATSVNASLPCQNSTSNAQDNETIDDLPPSFNNVSNPQSQVTNATTATTTTTNKTDVPPPLLHHHHNQTAPANASNAVSTVTRHCKTFVGSGQCAPAATNEAYACCYLQLPSYHLDACRRLAETTPIASNTKAMVGFSFGVSGSCYLYLDDGNALRDSDGDDDDDPSWSCPPGTISQALSTNIALGYPTRTTPWAKTVCYSCEPLV